VIAIRLPADQITGSLADAAFGSMPKTFRCKLHRKLFSDRNPHCNLLVAFKLRQLGAVKILAFPVTCEREEWCCSR
jgi:hypothetical protein